MSIKRFESLSLRLQHTCRGCLWLGGLLFTLIFISCVDGAAQSDQVVARAQKAFFEAWLGRELRSDELRKVTDEFIGGGAKHNHRKRPSGERALVKGPERDRSTKR